MNKLLTGIMPLVAVILIAGCSTVERPSGRATSAQANAPQSSKPALPPGRPLNVKADCSWRDENGYTGQLKLHVEQARVEDFSATVTHPKHGSCHFTLADFRQTRQVPNVELHNDATRCTVRMWSQGRQVTVAFSACQSMCSGDGFDYLWPILADSSNGTCG